MCRPRLACSRGRCDGGDCAQSSSRYIDLVVPFMMPYPEPGFFQKLDIPIDISFEKTAIEAFDGPYAPPRCSCRTVTPPPFALYARSAFNSIVWQFEKGAGSPFTRCNPPTACRGGKWSVSLLRFRVPLSPPSPPDLQSERLTLPISCENSHCPSSLSTHRTAWFMPIAIWLVHPDPQVGELRRPQGLSRYERQSERAGVNALSILYPKRLSQLLVRAAKQSPHRRWPIHAFATCVHTDLFVDLGALARDMAIDAVRPRLHEQECPDEHKFALLRMRQW